MRSNIDAKFSNIVHAQQHIEAAKVFKFKPGLHKKHDYCGCQPCAEKTGFDAFIRKAGHSNRVTMRVIKRRARKMRRLNDSIMTRNELKTLAG